LTSQKKLGLRLTSRGIFRFKLIPQMQEMKYLRQRLLSRENFRILTNNNFDDEGQETRNSAYIKKKT